MSKLSVLDGLKVTSHWSAHLLIVSKSQLIILLEKTGLSTTMNRVVSSANSRMLDLISLTISLMYIRKSSGPSIEPCGTPAFIAHQLDTLFLRVTLCSLFDK